MLLLLLPLYALDADTSIVGVGSLLALRSAGTLLVDIPAGLAIARFGEKNLILLSIVTMLVSCLGFILTEHWLNLAVFILLFGMGVGGWTLTRHSFVGGKTPNQRRGRTMSKLVGLQRVGMLLGPLLGGLISGFYGYEIAFLSGAVLCFIALLVCVFYLPKSVEKAANKGQKASMKASFIALPTFIKKHQQIFMTAALFVMILRLVRGSRQLILPLWAHHIGEDVVEIGLLMSTTAVAELCFIYVGGLVSDKYGRKWVAVPSLALLSIGLLLLPFCQTFGPLWLFAAVTGIANGLGGGVIMTLGADLAPKDDRSTFLGVWRLMADFSGTLSPLLIGWIGGVFALASASVFSGGVGLLGSVLMVFWVRETLVKVNGEPLKGHHSDSAKNP